MIKLIKPPHDLFDDPSDSQQSEKRLVRLIRTSKWLAQDCNTWLRTRADAISNVPSHELSEDIFTGLLDSYKTRLNLDHARKAFLEITGRIRSVTDTWSQRWQQGGPHKLSNQFHEIVKKSNEFQSEIADFSSCSDELVDYIYQRVSSYLTAMRQ